jgi:hypothetical protein
MGNPLFPITPGRLTQRAAATSTSLAEQVRFKNPRMYLKRGPAPHLGPGPSVLELRVDAERQRKFSERMKCARQPIFSAAAVESMTSAEIAQLLDDCFYDLVRTERRLLLDPTREQMRARAQR